LKKVLKTILILILTVVLLAVLYTFLYPLDGKIKSFNSPELQGYVGEFEENSRLAELSYLSLDGYYRPETVLYRDGYLYSSVHGKLIRTAENGSGTELLYDSENGETLGFDFDRDGNIIFCDPRFNGDTPGIFKAEINEGSITVTTVCTEADGIKLTCPDAFAVADNGIIFFSDATEFSPVKYNDANMAFQYEAYYHSSNGRVCAFDPESGKSWTVATGFSGANGISLSYDQRFIYVCETMEYCIWRIPVDTRDGQKGNGAELFISNVPGCVDNLNRGYGGLYWVGLVSPRSPSWDNMLRTKFLRTVLLHWSSPAEVDMPEKGTAAVFAFDDYGNIKYSMMDSDSIYHHITGACETDSRIYFHSNNYTGKIAYINKS